MNSYEETHVTSLVHITYLSLPRTQRGQRASRYCFETLGSRDNDVGKIIWIFFRRPVVFGISLDV